MLALLVHPGTYGEATVDQCRLEGEEIGSKSMQHGLSDVGTEIGIEGALQRSDGASVVTHGAGEGFIIQRGDSQGAIELRHKIMNSSG